MKTLIFCLFGLLALILTIMGFKKQNSILKILGCIMLVIFSLPVLIPIFDNIVN